MDVNEVISMIGSVGFPIVACIYMFKINQEQSAQHKDEMGKMTEALTDLKLAINSLIDKLN